MTELFVKQILKPPEGPIYFHLTLEDSEMRQIAQICCPFQKKRRKVHLDSPYLSH